MPFGDGTGRLGRGRNCDAVAVSDRAGGGFGRGRGFARGAGYGFRRYAEPTKAEEKAQLEAELKSAEADIAEIKKRLQELK